MFAIDFNRCTGCGICVEICPQKAITILNESAVIDRQLCTQCGTCAEVYPVGAIRDMVPVHALLAKGGEKMVYTFGRGLGGRGGAGFGFRGASPPWPYVGRGRGGLPRCSYPGLWAGVPYAPAPYLAYTRSRGMPYTPPLTREQELDFLKVQAEAVKKELNRVEARIHDLEVGK